MIGVNRVIWEWSAWLEWIEERMKIIEKGIATVKVQQEQMGHNVESWMGVPMDQV